MLGCSLCALDLALERTLLGACVAHMPPAVQIKTVIGAKYYESNYWRLRYLLKESRYGLVTLIVRGNSHLIALKSGQTAATVVYYGTGGSSNMDDNIDTF